MSFTGATARLPGSDATTFRILARSLVRELNRRGYAVHHIVTFANELIDLACDSDLGEPPPA
jgi:hypothetical protein